MQTVVVDGPVGSGKTRLICRIAADLSRDGLNVLIFSREDPPSVLTEWVRDHGGNLGRVSFALSRTVPLYGFDVLIGEKRQIKAVKKAKKEGRA